MNILSLFQIVHEKLYDEVVSKLTKAYSQITNKIGDPLESKESFFFYKISPLHRIN